MFNQFINNYIHERAMKDISDVKLRPIDKKELQEREDERLNDWRVVVNDERKQFKKSHHQMNFDEYKKATENSDKKIAELKAYLNEDRTTWLLEFDKIKPEALEANKQLFIDWWTDKIGTLTFANKFIIIFRVTAIGKQFHLIKTLIINYWRNYKKVHLFIAWMRCQHGSMKQEKK